MQENDARVLICTYSCMRALAYVRLHAHTHVHMHAHMYARVHVCSQVDKYVHVRLKYEYTDSPGCYRNRLAQDSSAIWWMKRNL